MKHAATYSPEDNKIRITPAFRLDPEEYARVKAAGFIWAPRQKIFVAPMWTPDREDLALEMCGEIGDEDTSLVDRAEERAERFSDYSDKRAEDAERAHKAVAAIADNIPMGQPILVGHHSERHARKDAERIENGMRKAVSMWETSKYWTYRAAGALRHAKYKERPEVRARRIKGLLADRRRIIASYTPKDKLVIMSQRWNGKADDPKEPHVFCGQARGGRWVPVADLETIKDRSARWLAHYENRLVYEKAMLDEQGKSDLLAPKPRPDQLPLCNYRVPEGFLMIENRYRRGEMEKFRQVDMTKAEYAKIYTDYKGTRIVENSHRVRIAYQARELLAVFITDSKEHAKPEPIEKTPVRTDELRGQVAAASYVEPEPSKFDAMKDALKEGVKVVVAPQLFPTPPEIAAQMVELAEIEPGQRILEPSAGTGNLLRAMGYAGKYAESAVTAIEIKPALCEVLRLFEGLRVRCADFLDCLDEQGFDRIIMNPPFENGVDIKHINHALTLLRPGGRLVALCANGPRQQKAFQDIAEHWESLPTGSFKEQGTGVNVALMVLTKERKRRSSPSRHQATQQMSLF